ncbi:hypothetical protein [uncultured Clostridium sp.]|uniref:hypothetical protein n=1 Tax=uncultured Clostridium sp. TaxID=59620 RepID=UPI0028E1DF52|nr:hypothetical protein [uncultured Clostridium sp.]
MKKFISILSIFLFLSISLNTICAFAQQTKTLTQGIYNAKDNNLLIGTPIIVKMASSNDSAMIIVIDSKQVMHALVRLNPQITQQVLPPLDYTDSVIIFGNGSVVLS